MLELLQECMALRGIHSGGPAPGRPARMYGLTGSTSVTASARRALPYLCEIDQGCMVSRGIHP